MPICTYYFVLKAFLIACHYKTYIMPILFLLLMSSYAILTCFMLDNTIMLTVCVSRKTAYRFVYVVKLRSWIRMKKYLIATDITY